MGYFPIDTINYYINTKKSMLTDMADVISHITGQRISPENLYHNFTENYEVMLSAMASGTLNQNLSYQSVKRNFYKVTEKIKDCFENNIDKNDEEMWKSEVMSAINNLSLPEKNVFSLITTVQDMYLQSGKEMPTLTDVADELFFYPTFIKWSKMKNVFKIDNDFAENILTTEQFELTPEEMRHLPFQTFWLDLSNCDAFGIIDGVLVNIENYDVPRLETYHFNRLGEQIFYHSYYLSVKEPVNEKSLKETLVNMPMGYLGIEGSDKVRLDNTMLVLQLLKYMSSKEPDINHIPVQKKATHTLKKAKPSDVDTYELGYVFGSNFRLYKEQVEYYVSNNHTGRKVRPHYVSAHWQRYHVGKGRTETITKWIEPTFTGIDKEKVQQFCTIHRVKSNSLRF